LKKRFASIYAFLLALSLAVLSFAVLTFGVTGSKALFAQSTSAGPAPAPQADSQPKSSNDTFLSPRTARSENLAAAEDEDDNAVYRHSPSVRAVGRWLHLDQEQAARVFEFLNFGILAAAVLFFLFKKMPGMLRERRENIQKQLVEARTATEQANARLKAVEERFARLDQDIAAIRQQAEQESAAEEARIQASLETERQRIVSSAEQEIAAAAAAAQRDLKRFAAGLAVDRATRMISLNAEDDRSLIRHFAEELRTESRNGSHS
jgi:F-type H+-transporting ATPase subunit b